MRKKKAGGNRREGQGRQGNNKGAVRAMVMAWKKLQERQKGRKGARRRST